MCVPKRWLIGYPTHAVLLAPADMRCSAAFLDWCHIAVRGCEAPGIRSLWGFPATERLTGMSNIWGITSFFLAKKTRTGLAYHLPIPYKLVLKHGFGDPSYVSQRNGIRTSTFLRYPKHIHIGARKDHSSSTNPHDFPFPLVQKNQPSPARALTKRS